MAGAGLTRRKSTQGNGSRALLPDYLLEIRKHCGFLHMSLYSFFILPALVCVPDSFAGKRGVTVQIIVSCDRQAMSETERRKKNRAGTRERWCLKLNWSLS